MFKRIFGTASSLHSLQGATKTEGHSARTASRRAGLVAVLMAGTAIAPAMAQQAQQDNPLDVNPGMNRDSIANAVSADGTTAVGSWDGGRVGFIATSSQFDLIKDLTTALGVNANGTVVVGRSLDRNFNRRPMMWTVNGAVDLDPNGMYSQGQANAVNSDGTVIVGEVQDNGTTKYFRWTANGMQVGAFPFAGASHATGVSYDGSVVVGNGDDGSSGGTNSRAYRWIPATGDIMNLGTLNNGSEVHATGVSGDGRVVVGYAADGNQNGSDRAFYWTVDTSGNGTGTMTGLGTLNGGSVSRANATNRDGSVIVGIADIDGQNQITRGFRWTQATDMITVDQWLTNNGVTVGNNVTKTATGVSADGSVVVGQLQNGHAYIARGPVPVQPPAPNQGGATSPVQTTTAGLMDVTNYQQSLSATPGLAPQLQNADVVMNGAHSSPLFMLLDAGQSSAWFTGDGGYTSMRSAQGGIGAGEFGFGRGIEGGWTVRFAGGGQYARFDTPNAGNSVFSSGYIAPDVSYSVGGGVVATLSGYLNWGKADVRRGYLNGAANDSSFGSAATQTYGVRARLDWQDALKLASTGISPFVSYTYVNSQMNGYTETGGSFPVRFNGSREISNAVRIGADATTPLNDQFALVTRFEYGHRFEKTGAGVSGQILGLTAFSMDGASVQQDWLRGGLGVSYKLGNGDGLVMLNTSNQTGKNTTWVSASYRVKF